MSSSLTQLESESADLRAAKADAVAEIERLQDRRKRLLLAASVDEILSLDGEIRRQEIAGEIAHAKATFAARRIIGLRRLQAICRRHHAN